MVEYDAQLPGVVFDKLPAFVDRGFLPALVGEGQMPMVMAESPAINTAAFFSSH